MAKDRMAICKKYKYLLVWEEFSEAKHREKQGIG
jgi:hypothetical protein